MTELELEVRGADATWSLLALRFPHGAVLCGERRGQGTTQTFPEIDFDPERFDALAAALEHEAAVAGEAPGTLTMRRDGKELFARPCLADATISALVQASCTADPEGVGPQVARALGIEAGA